MTDDSIDNIKSYGGNLEKKVKLLERIWLLLSLPSTFLSDLIREEKDRLYPRLINSIFNFVSLLPTIPRKEVEIYQLLKKGVEKENEIIDNLIDFISIEVGTFKYLFLFHFDILSILMKQKF